MIADLLPEAWLPYLPVINYTVFSILCFYPVVRIFQRSGLNAFYSVILFIPMIGLVIISTILALKKWPHLPLETQDRVKEII